MRCERLADLLESTVDASGRRRIRLTIHGTLPGLNEIIAATNRHRYVGSTVKKLHTRAVFALARNVQAPALEGPVDVVFDWIEPNRRRDPDNIRAGAKFVLDGLVTAGVLGNDSRRWIRSIGDRYPEPDPVNPRVVVTLQEV